MNVMAFEPEIFASIQEMRLLLHNKQRAMTFDEQRDFAERLRLLLEKAEPVELPTPTPSGRYRVWLTPPSPSTPSRLYRVWSHLPGNSLLQWAHFKTIEEADRHMLEKHEAGYETGLER